jgi:hypothetical protein
MTDERSEIIRDLHGNKDPVQSIATPEEDGGVLDSREAPPKGKSKGKARALSVIPCTESDPQGSLPTSQ